MRDLINKITLLESGGTLSIPAIANLLSPTTDRKKQKNISFVFYQDFINTPLELEEGPSNIPNFRISGTFSIDENGNLGYFNPKSIMFIVKIEPIPIDNLRNEMIIGKTAIKILKQLFGIDDTDYAAVTYHEKWGTYVVEITNSREFLALVNEAYQWRQENIGDLP